MSESRLRCSVVHYWQRRLRVMADATAYASWQGITEPGSLSYNMTGTHGVNFLTSQSPSYYYYYYYYELAEGNGQGLPFNTSIGKLEQALLNKNLSDRRRLCT